MFWQCTSLQTKDLLKLKFILCSAICVGQPKQTMRSLGLGTKSTRYGSCFGIHGAVATKLRGHFQDISLNLVPLKMVSGFTSTSTDALSQTLAGYKSSQYLCKKHSVLLPVTWLEYVKLEIARGSRFVQVSNSGLSLGSQI